MASIAVLPVLIGLAVDYAIQFQARFDEERERHPRRPRGGGRAPPRAGGPTIVTAGLATAVGFLVLLCSPVPMVRGFGALLVLGIGLALACALCAGFAALMRFGGAPTPPALPRVPSAGAAGAGRPRGGPGAVADAGRGAAPAWAGARARRAGCWRSGWRWRVRGWRSTPRARWCPTCASWCRATCQALEDVNELQEETGVAGEIDVTVRAEDITDPEVRGLDDPFPARRAARARLHARASAARQERDPPELCPALSLPDLRPPPAATEQRRARCSTRCRPTSRRASSPGIAGRPTWPSASGSMPLDAPEGGGGRHQAPARSACGRGGRGGRSAGARRRGQRGAVLALAPRRWPCWPRCSGSSWCCWSSGGRFAPPRCR